MNSTARPHTPNKYQTWSKMEAARAARIKHVAKGFIATIKKVDDEARLLCVQEMHDITEVMEQALVKSVKEQSE